MFDVIVIGGGPAGCTAARECAGAGLHTIVLEEHGTIGYPVQCAGLLSTKAFSECDVSDRSVLHTVTGARVVGTGGETLSFDAKTTKAVVVDRGSLDFEMAKAAADAGAEFATKTTVLGINGVRVLTSGTEGHREFSGKILIAADGPRSSIARLLHMERARTFLAGIQADIPHEMEGNLVEIYPDAAPDFFGYAIPTGKGRARIGLCSGEAAGERFSAFSRIFTDRTVHLVTGTVPLGVMPRTFGHRVLFAGDAGGFAKPTSGGGIYTGVRTGRHAARVAIECCGNERFDDAALAVYEQYWKEDIGSMLATGYRFFQLRSHLRCEDIRRLLKALDDPAVIDAILRYGDMDRPELLLKVLVRKPALIAALGSLMGPILNSLLSHENTGAS